MKLIQNILLSMVFLFGGCDYLDMVPEGDIETTDAIFTNRKKADTWLYTAHKSLMFLPRLNLNPAYLGADEYTTGNYMRNSFTEADAYGGLHIGDGLQMSQEPYGDAWNGYAYYSRIRYCNTFLQKIWDVYDMEEPEKKQWAAEVKAVKAFYYFDLVRHYGPIVLVPENIATEASIEEMKMPRVHVDTCFKEIVRLLDEAIVDLLPDSEKEPSRRGYFCKESALMLKAKVLLTAASPLFNGNEFYVNFKDKNGESLFSESYDPERWRLAAEAIDEAVETCEFYGRGLYSGSTTARTELLNTMRDIEESVHDLGFNNTECLFSVRNSGNNSNGNDTWARFIMPSFVSTDGLYNSNFLGTLSPSMKMVEMFYTDNGLPIDQDKTWDYTGRYEMNREADSKYKDVVSLDENVLSLHLRREPRFYANIAADRCYWRQGVDDESSKVTRNYQVKAYKNEQFGTRQYVIQNSNPQNINGYFLKKYLYSTLKFSTYPTEIRALGDNPVPIMRMAELYLMQAEAWNEYEGPSDKVYAPLNKVRERAGIPDVVSAWKNYSRSPEKVDSKEGMREIIHREYDVELAFEGQRFWNLRRWKTAHLELNEVQMGWNVVGETAQSFYNNFQGPVVVWAKRKFVSPRDYLFPLRNEEVMISSYVQNPGW